MGHIRPVRALHSSMGPWLLGALGSEGWVMSENLSGRLIDLIRARTGVADLPVVISCDDRRDVIEVSARGVSISLPIQNIGWHFFWTPMLVSIASSFDKAWKESVNG